MPALPETTGLYGQMKSIKECFAVLLSPWRSEDSRTFLKRAAIKRFQVLNKKTVSIFTRHPNGSVSRLNTDKLLLAGSASCKF